MILRSVSLRNVGCKFDLLAEHSSVYSNFQVGTQRPNRHDRHLADSTPWLSRLTAAANQRKVNTFRPLPGTTSRNSFGASGLPLRTQVGQVQMATGSPDRGGIIYVHLHK